MSVVILDFGSGETCKNDKTYVHRMINELAAVDNHKHQVFIKWQLFTVVPAPVPALDHEVFFDAVKYAWKYDYLTSASVFDELQLDYLLSYRAYGLPFVKLACRPHTWPLLKKIPHDMTVYLSLPDPSWRDCLAQMYPGKMIRWLYCIPEYPADQTAYESLFGGNLHYGISDHSPDLRLFKEYEPLFYERHYRLQDSTGLDAGPHASTPKQLEDIL